MKIKMSYTRFFEDITKADVTVAGGKGASLGEMTQAGISVPPGFVVTAQAFEEFLRSTDLNVELDAILDHVDHAVMHTIDDASERIKALILGAPMPEAIATEIQQSHKKLDAQYVAVRSSATSEDSADAAWAGQLESYLNTTEDRVLENVKKCWASLFTPRAIFYRFEKGLHGKPISVAVVIQKMVESEVSGIAFSVHPVTQDYDQLIIEAGIGLGEAIVSGSITPDSFVVEKSSWNLLDKNITTQDRGLFRKEGGENEWKDIPTNKGEQPTLTDDEVVDLAKLVVKIEQHYGFPVDVEWAREGGQFYIVQSRPITTLQKRQKPALKSLVLSKIFSREKTLFYFSMWNDSDRRGWKNFLGYEVTHNLFVVPPPGRKGSVWYSQKELADFEALLKEKLKNDPTLIARLTKTLDTNWKVLLPYLSDKKELKSVKEFKKYYDHLVDWWSAMTTAFTVPDMVDVDENVRKTFLSYRIEAEKYTEKMNKVLVVFWKEHFPKYTDLTFFIAPSEVENFSELVAEIEQRKNGCLMLDGTIYPLERLDSLLKESGLVLEEVSADGAEDIKGTPAYPGKVRGKVKKILSFADMDSFKAGEVLVTEMTNPDYVPIMKIATAVVTDEGGATCHAAIASRELQVPCIVGTKIATHVLKDGDEVEVDADKGVLKIISSSPKNIRLTPTDYVRMFANKSFVYLLSDVFLQYYNVLGVLSIQDEKTWISFLPKSSQEKTQKEGKGLYTSKESYEQYSQEFHDYIKSSMKYFNAVLAQDEINASEVKKFFALASQHFSYYSKTEFFYTDLLDQEKMALTVQEFDKLKLDGRSYLNKIIFENKGFVRTLIRKLSSQTAVPESDLLSYSIQEIVELVESGKQIDQDTLKKRFVFFHSKNLTLFGEEARLLVDEFLSVYRGTSDIIRGTIANKGKARGKARVFIPDFSDFDKIADAVDEMQEGEILVAETTAPEIIQACKKAAAIITNQGGMLSHAAIVSRELGVPCIIGADKDLLLSIKTGDEVEVDADQGVIRILNKFGIESPTLIRSSDYKTLFKLKGRLTCLHSEFFVQGSLGLGDAVVVFKDGNWHTFINQEKERLCLQKGAEVFSGKDSYAEYADGFRAYIAMAQRDIIPRFKTPTLVSKEELQELLPVLGKFWYFYGMTEFSYHDLAYQKLLDTKDPILQKNLDDLGKLKFEGRELLNAYIFEEGVLHNLLQGISNEYLKNSDDAEFLFSSELLGLYDGQQVADELIEQRRQAYGCASIKGSTKVFAFEEALQVWDELHSEKKSSVIKGIVANRGKASGRVVIAPMLVSPKAIAEVAAKMKQGDILVAESTTPELMSLCKKAAAIVTDQGGMLSHAAIVSRELNVPCIIGTGDATEVLEDGDLVEVDADKGTVKVLKRS